MAKINFFCPSPVLPLMEIVCADMTSPQIIADLIDLGKNMKKTPIVVSDSNDYTVNRLIITYLHAAILLAEQGVDAYQVDRAITSFGMPYGPFRMIDLVGFQVASMISNIFVKNFPDRSYKPKVIQIMQQDGRQGESNGRGFYTYDEKHQPGPDPNMINYIENSRTITDMAFDSKPPPSYNKHTDTQMKDEYFMVMFVAQLTALSDREIVKIVLFPALNEACRIISDGITFRTSDLDVASVKGMGFPAYRGGIICWSDSVGSAYIYSRLDEWSKVYGEFFKPSSYLAKRASKGTSLGNLMIGTKSQLYDLPCRSVATYLTSHQSRQVVCRHFDGIKLNK